MKIYEICDRCGKIYGTIEIDGQDWFVNRWLTRVGRDCGMCLDCGGIVQRMKENEIQSGKSVVSKLLNRFRKRGNS